MPSATDQLRGRMEELFSDPIDDTGPIAFLQKRGFHLLPSFEWRPPHGATTWEDFTTDEQDCLEFLMDEWDFGGIDWNG